MLRRSILLAAGVLAAVALATPATAAKPQRTQVAVDQVVQGTTSCGVLRWEISLTGERFRFFDQDGNLTKVQIHIREDNVIRNLTTGEALREGPDSFMQRTLFTDEGPLIVATGLAARVPGTGVRDVGRVVIDPANRRDPLLGGSAPDSRGPGGRERARGVLPRLRVSG